MRVVRNRRCRRTAPPPPPLAVARQPRQRVTSSRAARRGALPPRRAPERAAHESAVHHGAAGARRPRAPLAGAQCRCLLIVCVREAQQFTDLQVLVLAEHAGPHRGGEVVVERGEGAADLQMRGEPVHQAVLPHAALLPPAARRPALRALGVKLEHLLDEAVGGTAPEEARDPYGRGGGGVVVEKAAEGAEESRREDAARAAAVRLARLGTEGLEPLHARHRRAAASQAVRVTGRECVAVRLTRLAQAVPAPNARRLPARRALRDAWRAVRPLAALGPAAIERHVGGGTAVRREPERHRRVIHAKEGREVLRGDEHVVVHHDDPLRRRAAVGRAAVGVALPHDHLLPRRLPLRRTTRPLRRSATTIGRVNACWWEGSGTVRYHGKRPRHPWLWGQRRTRPGASVSSSALASRSQCSRSVSMSSCRATVVSTASTMSSAVVLADSTRSTHSANNEALPLPVSTTDSDSGGVAAAVAAPSLGDTASGKPSRAVGMGGARLEAAPISYRDG
eukprot:scaffold68326_cov75-Phaeocystis_antarctica.AAC.3